MGRGRGGWGGGGAHQLSRGWVAGWLAGCGVGGGVLRVAGWASSCRPLLGLWSRVFR
eukprot:COSAG01_NODE_54192_length_333_cov_7.508547_1_plen_56_part_01